MEWSGACGLKLRRREKGGGGEVDFFGWGEIFLRGEVSPDPISNRRDTMWIDTKKISVILCKCLVVESSAWNRD